MFSTFYCVFVLSFVAILHLNLFFPQTNHWRAAICKTEEGESIELQRRLDEEKEMAGMSRRSKLQREEWKEPGKHRKKNLRVNYREEKKREKKWYR